MKTHPILFAAAFICLYAPASADIKLARLFGDHTVLLSAKALAVDPRWVVQL